MAFLDRLNPRERRLLTGLGAVLAVLVVLGLPFGLEALIYSYESGNEDLRAALNDVQEGRSKVHDRQAKREGIAQRYAKKAPLLAGFIEQLAHAQKLEVTDSVDRPEIPHGKRYVERSTQAHLKKSGMLPIARFLEAVEKSGDAVSVTRLNIRKRPGEPDAYEVELAISAFDRSAEQPKPKEADREPDAGKEKDKKP
jgi:type II secretory pathway component PulM